MSASPAQGVAANRPRNAAWLRYAFVLSVVVLLAFIFAEAARNLHWNVTRADSYYSHSYFVPFVSLFLVWRKREQLATIPRIPANAGFGFLLLACALVLVSDLLGFRILAQAALLPMIAGLLLVFAGWEVLRRLWFPIAFLAFMIPLPQSLTTSLTFRLKILAADGAVWLCNLFQLPMLRDGSYIHVVDDRLLVGDVCGGMRSMIALVALGALVAYLSETRPWARIAIVLMSPVIAVAANLLRIAFLCVVAYGWNSETASGWVHDFSGMLIYVVAIALLLGLDGLLRRVAPANSPPTIEPAA
jgi:exosortase